MSNTVASRHPAAADNSKTVFGFWVYIMTDCVLFATLFATFAVLHNNTNGGPPADEIFSLPFVLAFTASAYGLCVGVVCIPAKTLAVSALEWFSPLIFGFYVFTEMMSATRRDAHLAMLEWTFCWGALIMG